VATSYRMTQAPISYKAFFAEPAISKYRCEWRQFGAHCWSWKRFVLDDSRLVEFGRLTAWHRLVGSSDWHICATDLILEATRIEAEAENDVHNEPRRSTRWV
jgi:hypothetical protein